jgi:phosphoribosylglycinamide formyltransferase-1
LSPQTRSGDPRVDEIRSIGGPGIGDRRLRVGVLLGERPDLLRALLDVVEIEVVAVARDRGEIEAPPPPGVSGDLFEWWPQRGPGARERREAGIAEWFVARGVGLVIAAGWLWILSPAFLAVFGDRIINVHPTLLPAFPGRHSVERAVEHGVRVHGVTVHRIDERVDAGPILAQAALPVDGAADAAEIRRRLAPLECRLLADVARAIARES